MRTARRSRITSRFNGETLPDSSVSTYVSSLYCQLDGRAWSVDASHESSLPMGCGFGTSGAGALSLSLALNEAMGLSLSKIEAAQLAHISEVRLKTGLGTVASVFSGGLTLRVKPGAPGIGEVAKISVPSSLRLASVSFGPLSTSRILATSSLKKRVNSCGTGLMRRFQQHDAATSFVSFSKRFSDCLGIASRRLSELIRALDAAQFKSSMMMLGESMFCILPRELVPELSEVLQRKGLTPLVSSIAKSGAHLV